MSFTHGRKARLFFAGLNLSSFLRNADLDDSRDVAETSVFTDESKTYVAGQKDAKATVAGVFDGSAGAQDAAIVAAFDAGGGDIFTYLPAGDGFGVTAVCWRAIEIAYKRSTPINDSAKWDMESQVTAGTERARVLHALAAEVGAVNGASYDWGASAPTDFGGAAYLQVIGTGPVAAFTVTVEHSSDNGGGDPFTTAATFTAATDKTAERVVIAAGASALKRYTRYTVSGTTGGLKISVALARFIQ